MVNYNTNIDNKLSSYFSIKDVQTQSKIIKLDDVHLYAGLEYLFKCATKELIIFKHKRFLKKHCKEKDGILYSKTRLEETAKLRFVGHLSDFTNIETFTRSKQAY